MFGKTFFSILFHNTQIYALISVPQNTQFLFGAKLILVLVARNKRDAMMKNNVNNTMSTILPFIPIL